MSSLHLSSGVTATEYTRDPYVCSLSARASAATVSERARLAMLTVLLAPDNQGRTRTEIAKAIDAAYPFGAREGYAYRVWLSERKVFFAKHSLPRNGDHRTSAERRRDLVALMESEV